MPEAALRQRVGSVPGRFMRRIISQDTCRIFGFHSLGEKSATVLRPPCAVLRVYSFFDGTPPKRRRAFRYRIVKMIFSEGRVHIVCI